MKKILILHNNYRNFGGEDSNLENEISFLNKHYIVEKMIVTNPINLNLKTIVSLFFLSNADSNKQLKNKINEFKPDLAYVHNTWFMLSLGIFKILKKEKIKTVIKIHNFRYRCAISIFKKNHLMGESFCKSCNFNVKDTLFFNKYFHESYLKSLFVIYYSKKYLKILENTNCHIFSISQFHKDKILEMGIQTNKVKLFPNPFDMPLKNNYNSNSNYIVYAGRITKEKGLDELLSSWVSSNLDGIGLKIIGTGEILNQLVSKYDHKNIEFLGELENKHVLEMIKNSRAVVTATKMYEGHSRLLTEASSFGIPAIFPKFGSMIEFFPKDYQLSFEQYNYKSLTQKLIKLADKKLLEELSLTSFNYINEKLNQNVLISQFNQVLDYEK